MSGINQELKQPLRVYDSLSKQSYARTAYLNSVNNIDLVCPRDTFIPFTLVKTTAPTADLTSIIFTNALTGKTKDLTSLFTTTIITDYSATTGYIRYYADSALAANLPYGVWYFTATDGTNTWYSELFCIGDISECVRFRYSDKSDLSNFIYQYDFENFFYIEATIAQNEKYISFKEEIEDALKNRTTIFDRVEKRFEINFVCRMPIYDAIQIMKIHGSVYLQNQQGEESQIKIEEVNGENIGNDYIKCTIEFTIVDDYLTRDELYEQNRVEIITPSRNITTGGETDTILDENGNTITY